ncbi:response regulator [Xanthobacter sp. AM11]|uniref:response regulator n=1 Tax=Xanthobacter sp. AM11 TaxID=3380643 RepID=UPI0039BF2A7C
MERASTLIVDDDRDLLVEVREGLAAAGIPVLCTSTSASAIDIVENNADIGVVVTDLGLPNIDGIELLQRLQQVRLHTPVAGVVITGAATLDKAVAALRLNVVDFLQKPFDIADLAAAIRRARAIFAERAGTAAQAGSPVGHLKALLGMRIDRKRLFPEKKVGDTAWDMMLDLALAQESGQRLSVTSLCAAAGTSVTTALRRLEALEAQALVQRLPDETDRRRTWVHLTPVGSDAVRELTRRYSARIAGLE